MEKENTQQLGSSITPGKTKCFVFGLRTRGYLDLRDIKGKKIGGDINHKKLKLLERARGSMQEVKSAIPLPIETGSPLAQI